LLVVGCWLLVVGCWLLVVGCWLLVVGSFLLRWFDNYSVVGSGGAFFSGVGSGGSYVSALSARSLAIVVHALSSWWQWQQWLVVGCWLFAVASFLLRWFDNYSVVGSGICGGGATTGRLQ
jgi:hypothetical protein